MFLFNLLALVKPYSSIYSLEVEPAAAAAAAVGVFEESFGDLAWVSLSSDSSSLTGRLLSVMFPRPLVIYEIVSRAKSLTCNHYLPILEHRRRDRGRSQ
jgi:hypothetical protein